MPALPPLPLTLVLCAMVAMAAIGTAHADSPAKLQYWEQMKAMMQAADGDSLGDSQSRAAAVVTFVVDAGAGFRGGQSHGVIPRNIAIDQNLSRSTSSGKGRMCAVSGRAGC
jgi:hypothetical protein